jgi:dTDP-4-amino-4,6-dideoxygalactose transaminase
MTARLAIDGGVPAIPEGPPLWPRANERVQAALEAAYRDGSRGKYHGGKVEELEARLSAMHGVGHALTCCSGTFAVELALRALRVGPGAEVIVAGYDFPGNFRAIEAVGARPVLVDIDPRTWCLDAQQLEQAFSSETKAVVVSHLHGGLADMQRIAQLCRVRGVGIVEDACQSPGGQVQGRVAATWGDIGVLSFGGSKLLTAGRGGAILTSDPQLAQRAKIFCERGNHAFPLSELQAAVLLPQLETFKPDNMVRRERVAQLLAALDAEERFRPVVQMHGDGSYYKLAWLYEPSATWPRERFVKAVQAEGVALDAGFRGFAGRTAARCRRIGDLVHSRATVIRRFADLPRVAEAFMAWGGLAD